MKNKTKLLIALMLIAIITLGSTSCSNTIKVNSNSNNSTVEESKKDFGDFGKAAYSYVEYMQNNLTKRRAGTKAEKDTAEYIISVLKQAGYETKDIERQAFEFGGKEKKQASENIVVTLKGNSDKVIVVGAHYDCVNTSGMDDNASGVAVVLESVITLKDKDMPYTMKFVFFGAEEVGISGSKNYVELLSEKDRVDTILMVNLDSILAGDKAYIYGGAVQADGTILETWAVEQAKDIAEELDLDINLNPGKNSSYVTPTTGDWSDHASFKAIGMPYVYFEAGNWDLEPFDGSNQTEKLGEIMHTSNDDLTIINKNFPGRAHQRLATFSMLLQEFLFRCNKE